MWYRRLSIKLIFWVAIISVLVIGVFAYVNVTTQREHMLDEVVLGARQLSGALKRSLRFNMLHNYRQALYNSIDDVGTQEGIGKVRIFNKEGIIMFSSDKGEIGQMVDKKAEACYACHAVDKPLEHLDIPKRSRIFKADGDRVLGMISPIYNEPDCYTAACHYHPGDRTVLGVLDISLTLAATDKRLNEIRDKTILFAAITILAVSAMIGLFIQRAVYRPVETLAKATNKVASGNFDHVIPLHAEDEIGQLAESFNKMTQRLKMVQYQLLQSEKLASIGKLAATIAHEINNPLNGILTYTKLIQRKLAGGSIKENDITKLRSNLAIMERETERCSSIVRNLLDFARQREPSLRPDVDINSVVEEALALLTNQIALQEITLEKRYAQLPHIMADPRQLRQAFLNIILNSCEAIQTGGKLTVTTTFSRKNRTVRLQITDNGAGIPTEDLPKIFDPFFTSKEKGTGLGLSVVYGIITSHQGTVDVRSAVGEGTTITVILPTEIKLSKQGSIVEERVERRHEKAFMPR